MTNVRSLIAVSMLAASAPLFAQEAPFDLLLSGGRVIDGTGNPWFYADIAIRDGRIVAIGDVEERSARRVLDVSGLTVTPGFIDLHSHADGRGGDGLRSDDPARRAAPNLVSQGVTTVVVNQDGGSPYSISEQRRELEQKRFGPNAVLLVGHNTVRAMVMAEPGSDPFADEQIGRMQRLARPEEIDRMRALVVEGMEAGAYGMSAGLEYIPGRWSDTEEVVALVEVLAPYEGVFIEHERASGADPMWYLPSFEEPGQPTFLDSIEETIEIAERTGVTSVATHAKARGADYWGSSRAAVQLIERARARGVNVYADHYPYNTTGSDGSTRLIPAWIREENEELSWTAALEATLADERKAEALRKDILHEVSRRGGAENIVVMEAPNEAIVGKTFAELMRELDLGPVELALHLQRTGDADTRGGVRLRGYSLSEIDVDIYASEPWMATASDAGIALPGDGFVHARYYGTFPRKIRRYAMERERLSVESALRSMASLPAQILGFRNRGLLREGFHADVVVMDLDAIQDTATFFEPHSYAEGIVHVLVGGEAVVENGELIGALPGVVITPEDGRAAPVTTHQASESLPPPYPREGATKVLENERVVIWDVTWEKGIRTPLHRHVRNVVSVDVVPGVVNSILPDGTTRSIEPAPVGHVLYGGEGLVHEEEGASDTPRRAMVVELMEGSPAALERPEGVALAWPREGAEKILENDRVVVWDYTFRADREIPLHFHDKDAVVVDLTPGTTRSVSQDGRTSVTERVGGQARFAPRGRLHREEHVAGTPRSIVIELK